MAPADFAAKVSALLRTPIATEGREASETEGAEIRWLKNQSEGAMRTASIWTAAFVVSAVLAAFVQQPPCCFEVLNPAGKPFMAAKLGDAPYKPGMDAGPSVDLSLDGTKPVLDKKGQVISGFRFYGWMDGANILVAVLTRLPPEGAENKFYRWPDLNKAGMKPRYEVLVTYALAAGEMRPMDELKAFGVQAVALRSVSNLPSR